MFGAQNMPNPTTLRRPEIAKILKRHRGSKAELARRAGVKLNTVSGWLKGMTVSDNIATKAQALALELQERNNVIGIRRTA